MNRIDTTFANLSESGRSAFVAYICAGDPDFERSLEIARSLADAGADVLELGVPFSDPQADGIVNQLAAERALDTGMNCQQLIEFIKAFRQTHQTPIVLFTYLNPIYTYGYDKFLTEAEQAGADGILLLDLPPDETPHNSELSASIGLKQITLISPSTPPDRLEMLAKQSQGFIYAVSRLGVTGAQAAPSAAISDIVQTIQQHTKTPVCVGFGINTPEQAAQVAGAANGVVVGSAIVNQVAEHANDPNLSQRIFDFTRPLIEATHNA